MIVYVASCSDKNHTHDAKIVSLMRNIPNVVDSFESYTRIGDKKFCIAAMVIADEQGAVRTKKIMEWMFPALTSIRRMDDHPFF
ncbi:MAG: hypothetical protein KGH71_04845 [Candidatus Micrarchaeota archaeon]|nr:hypothetical protein [Candidatus Micrarchaeota archaeon]